MNSRIPFVAAVVGALLIGGATTGGTFATWKDISIQAGDSITAGKIGFAHSESKASFSLNKGTPAVTDTVEVTVTDVSAGKNMVQRISPSVTWSAGVSSVAVKTKVSGSCSSTNQSDVSLTPTASFTMCLTATVDSTTSLSSSTVTVTLVSQQMRGSTATGWKAPTQAYAIPVAITQPAAAAPRNLTCSGSNVSSATMSWQAPASGSPTGYEVYSVNDNSFSKSVSGLTATITEVELPGNLNIVVGVRAVYSGGLKSTANPTVEFSQNQGQGGRVTCGTPVNP